MGVKTARPGATPMITPILTRDQEAQAQQLADQLKQSASEQFLAIARRLIATDEQSLFGQTEFDLRAEALKVVGQAYTLHLAQKKNGYYGSSIDCPKCRKPAPYHGQ